MYVCLEVPYWMALTIFEQNAEIYAHHYIHSILQRLSMYYILANLWEQ